MNKKTSFLGALPQTQQAFPVLLYINAQGHKQQMAIRQKDLTQERLANKQRAPASTIPLWDGGVRSKAGKYTHLWTEITNKANMEFVHKTLFMNID